MNTFWSWLIQHWKALGIPISFSATAGAIVWVYRTYKTQRQKRVDAKVLDALGNRDLWKGNRPFTGGGESLVRAREIADVLRLSPEIVFDSLERLETQGKARKADGTSDNPAPYWNIVRRW